MRSKDTQPELALRSALRALRLRYRLHRDDLPGTPDIVFIGPKLAVFVHGCYWHRHSACVGRRFSANVSPVWARRFNKVVSRDSQVEAALKALGWHTMVCWECRIQENPLAEATRVEARLARIASERSS
jgi:DNA mismatch endonuclease (patch repair protein)